MCVCGVRARVRACVRACVPVCVGMCGCVWACARACEIFTTTNIINIGHRGRISF